MWCVMCVEGGRGLLFDFGEAARPDLERLASSTIYFSRAPTTPIISYSILAGVVLCVAVVRCSKVGEKIRGLS